jgi:hypothetical protein
MRRRSRFAALAAALSLAAACGSSVLHTGTAGTTGATESATSAGTGASTTTGTEVYPDGTNLAAIAPPP